MLRSQGRMAGWRGSTSRSAHEDVGVAGGESIPLGIHGDLVGEREEYAGSGVCTGAGVEQ